jgi:hypothetical protein
MALFVAARIARTSIHERAGHLDRPLVGDLYNDDELPYRAGFRLTLMEVASRFDAGMEELSRMAIVVAVARIDELLGEFINCLGRLAMTCRDPERSTLACRPNSTISDVTPASTSQRTRSPSMACPWRSDTR